MNHLIKVSNENIDDFVRNEILKDIDTDGVDIHNPQIISRSLFIHLYEKWILEKEYDKETADEILCKIY